MSVRVAASGSGAVHRRLATKVMMVGKISQTHAAAPPSPTKTLR